MLAGKQAGKMVLKPATEIKSHPDILIASDDILYAINAPSVHENTIQHWFTNVNLMTGDCPVFFIVAGCPENGRFSDGIDVDGGNVGQIDGLGCGIRSRLHFSVLPYFPAPLVGGGGGGG